MAGLTRLIKHNRLLGDRIDLHALTATRLLPPFARAQATGVPLILSEDDPLPPSQRLVVILPDAAMDLSALPRRIWQLAAPDCRQVVLVMRPAREENEFNARLTLATLAALIRDPHVAVQTKLVLGMPLARAVGQIRQPGDVLVCFAGHQVRGLLQQRRLAQILAQQSQGPVYTLNGAVSEWAAPIPAGLADFLHLLVCLIAIVAFFALQVWIDRNASGATETLLQILTLIVEVGVIGSIASKPF